MLTEKERKWLEERKKRTQHCDNCPNRVGYYELCSSCRSRSLYGLSLCPDYREAAEFAERVAAKLTLKEPCPLPEHEESAFSCRWCRLKRARIAVEEEMKE